MQINIKIIALVITAFILNCNVHYIKHDVIHGLEKKYSGKYRVLKDISYNDTDSRAVIRKGSIVKLYFYSGDKNVKVYAYNPDEKREKALGKIILYLFDTDFPDGKFDENVLDQKLMELVTPLK